MGEIALSINLSDSNMHLLELIHNPEYNLTLSAVCIAKHHNYFGTVDNYMREFAGILAEDKNIPQHIINNL